ncbi:hypothetical protein L6164_034411 [Bauhinia variegata]|uniref:Uncharacterized protein n=1 Tax=Bauhinia variegata TaxID=167791 RepID=A0ACB9KV62_BAUVA|nr:hypothetical protein L6164_034411 [Bauhinia variegata]
MLTVPQNYAVAARALSEGFEYVTFKTNERAMMATLAGRNSVLNALPEQVLRELYQLRAEQVYGLKWNNQNVFLVAPRSSQMTSAA